MSASGTPAVVEADRIVLPEALLAFIGARTPPAWVDAAAAAEALPVLLVDHANCEKKAASTAVSMLFRYEGRDALTERLSRLAREELRHFEQVRQLMRRRGIAWQHVTASRYAAGLAEAMRKDEPARLIDRLVVGAFIEARSCERFALLAPRLDPELGRFYAGLLASEARHFQHYLELAASYATTGAGDGDGDVVGDGDAGAGNDSLEARIAAIRAVENRLVTTPDSVLRFHSGPPA